MMRKILLIGFVSLVLVGILLAALGLMSNESMSEVQAFSAANSLYEAGNYQQAAQIYQQLLDQGVKDSDLYYNLGSAYYMQGELGRAIVNFQRAAELNPRDADIRSNLALAQSRVGSPFPDEAPTPIESLADLTGRWLSLNEIAIITVGLWFLLGLLLFTWRLFHPGSLRSSIQYVALLVLIMVLIAGISLGSRLYTNRSAPEGVVVAPIVAVSSEPGEQYVTELNLIDGTSVGIAERSGDWIRLSVPGNAVQGWIPVDAVESVASVHDSSQPLL
jgi:hypothetical protein